MLLYGIDASSSENVTFIGDEESVLSEELSTFRNLHKESGRSFVVCRVCTAFLDVAIVPPDACVIKCGCGESTPILVAPVGLKYYRCSCRCLLLCSNSSSRIMCPRCEKISILKPNFNNVSLPVPIVPIRRKMVTPRNILCAHCNKVFTAEEDGHLVACKFCSKKSSLSKLTIGHVLGILLVLLTPALFFTGIKYFMGDESKLDIPVSFYYLYGFFVGLILIVVIITSCSMKVSTVQSLGRPRMVDESLLA